MNKLDVLKRLALNEKFPVLPSPLVTPSELLALVEIAAAAKEVLIYIECTCTSRRRRRCPRCLLRDKLGGIE